MDEAYEKLFRDLWTSIKELAGKNKTDGSISERQQAP